MASTSEWGGMFGATQKKKTTSKTDSRICAFGVFFVGLHPKTLQVAFAMAFPGASRGRPGRQVSPGCPRPSGRSLEAAASGSGQVIGNAKPRDTGPGSVPKATAQVPSAFRKASFSIAQHMETALPSDMQSEVDLHLEAFLGLTKLRWS